MVLDPELQVHYQGECRDGLAHGQGEAYGLASYVGGFHLGRKQGQGLWRRANGDVYQGNFQNDLPDGMGSYLWQGDPIQRGNRYVGGFLQGKRHGYGVLLTPAGDRYEGPWADDARSGQTATEIQFQRHYEAMNKVMAAGSTVCRDMTYGIGGVASVRGSVLDNRHGLLTIRVTSISPDVPGLPEILADQTLLAWSPCL